LHRWYGGGSVVFALVGVVAALAACGGSVNTTPIASSPSSTASPFVVSTTDPLASSGTDTVPLTAPGFSGALTLADVSSQAGSGLNVQLTLQNTAPAGLPALQSAMRAAQARPEAAPTGVVYNAIFYMKAVFSGGLSMNGGTLTLTVPNAPIDAYPSYYFAVYDPTEPGLGWQADYGGQATISGSKLTFTLPPTIFVAAETYGFAVFGLSPLAAPPTPVPTASPASGTAVIVVPTPAAVVCSPSPVAVDVGQTALLDCTAQEYAGPFAIVVADPTIALVQQSNSSTFTYFNVTGLKVGTTMLSLQSLPGGTGSVTITVAP
jgi:hypothetical protein